MPNRCTMWGVSEKSECKRFLLKAGSHRARERLLWFLSARGVDKPRQLCSFTRNVGGGVYEVSESLFIEAREKKMKGVTSFKDGEDLFKCWH
jgi:hypothetical protein